MNQNQKPSHDHMFSNNIEGIEEGYWRSLLSNYIQMYDHWGQPLPHELLLASYHQSDIAIVKRWLIEYEAKCGIVNNRSNNNTVNHHLTTTSLTSGNNHHNNNGSLLSDDEVLQRIGAIVDDETFLIEPDQQQQPPHDRSTALRSSLTSSSGSVLIDSDVQSNVFIEEGLYVRPQEAQPVQRYEFLDVRQPVTTNTATRTHLPSHNSKPYARKPKQSIAPTVAATARQRHPEKVAVFCNNSACNLYLFLSSKGSKRRYRGKWCGSCRNPLYFFCTAGCKHNNGEFFSYNAHDDVTELRSESHKEMHEKYRKLQGTVYDYMMRAITLERFKSYIAQVFCEKKEEIERRTDRDTFYEKEREKMSKQTQALRQQSETVDQLTAVTETQCTRSFIEEYDLTQTVDLSMVKDEFRSIQFILVITDINSDLIKRQLCYIDDGTKRFASLINENATVDNLRSVLSTIKRLCDVNPLLDVDIILHIRSDSRYEKKLIPLVGGEISLEEIRQFIKELHGKCDSVSVVIDEVHKEIEIDSDENGFETEEDSVEYEHGLLIRCVTSEQSSLFDAQTSKLLQVIFRMKNESRCYNFQVVEAVETLFEQYEIPYIGQVAQGVSGDTLAAASHYSGLPTTNYIEIPAQVEADIGKDFIELRAFPLAFVGMKLGCTKNQYVPHIPYLWQHELDPCFVYTIQDVVGDTLLLVRDPTDYSFSSNPETAELKWKMFIHSIPERAIISIDNEKDYQLIQNKLFTWHNHSVSHYDLVLKDESYMAHMTLSVTRSKSGNSEDDKCEIAGPVHKSCNFNVFGGEIALELMLQNAALEYWAHVNNHDHKRACAIM